MRPRRKSKVKGKSRTKHRASWQGNLTFGLVSFAVEAFNALDRQGSDIHFHQLHAKCHSRIRYQKVCPLHGEIANDEIVSGYEVRKGKYIEIDPDELDAARTQRERALTIDTFVEADAVDPLYFDGRMYYLAPSGEAAVQPYAVFATALEKEQRHGVGQVVFSGKEQLVLVRPLHGLLHMAMLNYAAEIRPPVRVVQVALPASGIGRQVRLAQTLIRDWSNDDFDLTAYEDTYREKVKELIQDKVAGREVVAPEEEDEPEVVNLMDALRKSLKHERPRPGKPAKRRRRKSA
jgi:DNA end-binding protein Ku